MFFSLHSKTCNISSLWGFISGGDFVLPKIGGVFVLMGFVREGFCPGGLLSWTPFPYHSHSHVLSVYEFRSKLLMFVDTVP